MLLAGKLPAGTVVLLQTPVGNIYVDLYDHALAMIGVYEFRDVSMAIDIFVWTYRRSLRKYQVIMEAMDAPDPLRLRYRQMLGEVIQQVVRERRSVADAFSVLHLSDQSSPGLREMVLDELKELNEYKCARFRLAMGVVEAWTGAGRPQ